MMWSWWWHWAAMAGIWLVVLATVVWGVLRLTPTGQRPRDALETLDLRLARGELGPDEYRLLRGELER